MEKYSLAPYFSCGFFNDELDIGFGSILITIHDHLEQEAYLKTALFMKEPRTLDELFAFIDQETDTSNKAGVYENFILKNFLIKENAYDSSERYSRDHLFYNLSGKYPKLAEQTLAQKHVTVLGCGGIGNIIATNLATSGVGQLTLTDDDHIELSNLTRQIMFRESDVGNKKTVTLKNALSERNRTISINTIDVLFDTQEKIDQLPICDLIVVSGDSAHICHYLNEFSFKNNVPFINVGYIQDIACWGPFIIPGKTACYNCFANANIANQTHELDFMIKRINQGYKAPSFGAINMLAGACATLDIIKYLAGFGIIQSLHKRVGLWTNHLTIEHQDYQQNPDCRLCAS